MSKVLMMMMKENISPFLSLITFRPLLVWVFLSPQGVFLLKYLSASLLPARILDLFMRFIRIIIILIPRGIIVLPIVIIMSPMIQGLAGFTWGLYLLV